MSQADLQYFETITGMPWRPAHRGQRVLEDLLHIMQSGDAGRLDSARGWLPKAA